MKHQARVAPIYHKISVPNRPDDKRYMSNKTILTRFAALFYLTILMLPTLKCTNELDIRHRCVQERMGCYSMWDSHLFFHVRRPEKGNGAGPDKATGLPSKWLSDEMRDHFFAHCKRII